MQNEKIFAELIDRVTVALERTASAVEAQVQLSQQILANQLGSVQEVSFDSLPPEAQERLRETYGLNEGSEPGPDYKPVDLEVGEEPETNEVLPEVEYEVDTDGIVTEDEEPVSTEEETDEPTE